MTTDMAYNDIQFTNNSNAFNSCHRWRLNITYELLKYLRFESSTLNSWPGPLWQILSYAISENNGRSIVFVWSNQHTIHYIALLRSRREPFSVLFWKFQRRSLQIKYKKRLIEVSNDRLDALAAFADFGRRFVTKVDQRTCCQLIIAPVFNYK